MKIDLEMIAGWGDVIEELIKLITYMAVSIACFKYVFFA